VKPRALDRNIDAALIVIARGDRDVLPLQVEEAQKIDKVAPDIAKAREILKLTLRELEAAEMIDLFIDFAEVRPEIHSVVPALEPIAHNGAGELMQHALHHRELIEVRIKERLDNHPFSSPALGAINPAASGRVQRAEDTSGAFLSFLRIVAQRAGPGRTDPVPHSGVRHSA
jgi:hypothetical protein